MVTITIALDDAQITQLKRLAEQRGQTLEQMVHDLLDDILLTPSATGSSTQHRGATLAIAGIIDDPAIRPLTAREIDEVLCASSHGVAG